MSKFNRFVNAFGRCTLARRWSGTSDLRRRSRTRSRRRRRSPRVSSSASLLRDKWREDSDRRSIETVGIIFSVKLIGLDVVTSAYDELGCQRALRKQGRKRRRRRHGYSSSPVLLSVSSTSVKIIQHHWVIAFEHAVTAISTCYTDLRRPRLFAYIVKEYTTGSHFCLAFKTMKKTGIHVSGKRLQRAFGYAFDSCSTSTPPPLLPAERNSQGSLAELEQCLQISSNSHQSRGILRSNSNFSASLESSPDHQQSLLQPVNTSTTTHTHGHGNSTQENTGVRRNQGDGLVMADNGANVSHDSAVGDRNEEDKRLTDVKLSHYCCHCCGSKKKINRSLSESCLHRTRKSLHLQPLTEILLQENNLSIGNKPPDSGESVGTGDVSLMPTEHDKHSNEPENSLDISPPVSVASDDTTDESDMKHLHKEYSSASNTSDSGVIILLAPSLHNQTTKRDGRQTNRHLGMDLPRQTQIERQVGYLNLPTHSSGVSNNTALELPTLPLLANTTEFDITSSETECGTDNNKTVLQLSCNDFRDAFHGHTEAFITELTTKLCQLEMESRESSTKQLVGLVLPQQQDPYPLSPIETETTPPTPPPRRESLDCDKNDPVQESGSTPAGGLSPPTSELADTSSNDTKQSNNSKSIITAPITEGNFLHVATKTYTCSDSKPLQSVAKSKAIGDQSGTSSRMVDGAPSVCGSCSQCLSAEEAQRQISRILNMVCSPQQANCSSGDSGAESGGKIRTLTCFIATWEQSTDNMDSTAAYLV